MQDRIVDTHAHLDDKRFDTDRPEVIARAIDAGVSFIIVPGTDLETSRRAIELTEEYEPVFATVGVHPHEVDGLGDHFCDELRELASHDKVVAIGEIGLDHYRDLSPRPKQRKAFEAQLALARELDLPVVVHCRDADEDIERMLTDGLRGVLHCFSGSVGWALRAVNLGFHIGIDGPVTYKNATKLREVTGAVPVNNLLVETDCPYMVPLPHKRSERNEPAYVQLVAEKIAEIKGLSLEDVARVTSLSVSRLFGIPCADETSRIAYVIRNSLYLNITNRCPNSCVFCIGEQTDFVKGHCLRLEREPTMEEIKSAMGDVSSFDEVVFCGYGEPTERLDVVKEIARWVHDREKPVRLVTSGLGDLVNGRPIATELKGLIDRVSISLNTADARQYAELARGRFGDTAHPAIINFIESCKGNVPEIEVTAVDYPGVDVKVVASLAENMGVGFRARRYNGSG